MKSPTPSPISDQAAGEHIDIVFDQVAVDGAPPEYSFIEVENSQRASIKFGEWIHRDDGYWVLRISIAPTTGSAPESDKNKWVAIVRVTNEGYAMELSKYIAYALPEGLHELYAASASLPTASVDQMIRAAKRFAVHWSGRSPANQDEAEAVLRKALLSASMGGDKS